MITRKQLTTMAINAIVVKMLVTFPRTLFEYCANTAWIACMFFSVVAWLLFLTVQNLYKSDANVIGTAEKIGGSGLRVCTGLLVFAVLGANIIGIFRTFPEIIRLVLLQKTYVEIIVTVFVLCIIFGAMCGIEAIARVTEIFIPVAGVIFAVFLLMLLPEMNIDYLFPILGNGIYSIAVKGISCMSLFTDLLLINILIPYAKTLDCYKKSGSRSIIIGGVCAVSIFLAYGLCYVYPASRNFIVPIYQLERLIHLSDFFSRLEAVFQFIWSIAIILYIALYAAVLSEVWRESFALKHSKPLIAPVVLVIAGVSMLPDSLNSMIYIEQIINKFIFIPAFLLPLIVGAIHKAKMFHVKQKGENKK